MANASAAIQSARTYLNDINAITWSDAVLMPLLQEAFGELQLELSIHRNPVIKAQYITNVPAVSESQIPPVYLPGQPANITYPISMYEKDVGDDDDSYDEMYQVTFLPNQDPDMELEFWSWQAQMIQFIGATTTRTVLLNYNGYLTTPNTLNDPLGFIYAERFLGPRIASIALSSIGHEKRAIYTAAIAEKNLYQVMQYNVTEDQRPYRRKKYRSAKSSFDVEGSTVPVGPIPSPIPNWIQPNQQPNGVAVVFTFNQAIIEATLNGLIQFPNVNPGFFNVGGFSYSFYDSSHTIITPASGVIIMGLSVA
jgi:hypothetical protein